MFFYFRDKTTRSCKRKLEIPALSLGSHDATKARDSEKKDLENPPPAKRWVIGPLLQSFRSKMACFTEIVMSPVQLFKPSELPAGSSHGGPSVTPEKEEEDGKEDAISETEEEITPVTKLTVVQRLTFDTGSSDASDSERNKVTSSQHGSDHRRDSIPGDGGSFGSLSSASTRRTTDQITGASKVQRCSREEKQECGSANLRQLARAGLLDASDSVRTSLGKGSGSGKAIRQLVVLCERKSLDELNMLTEQAGKSKNREQDQPLAKDLRLPTPAVGKGEKGRGLQRRELTERVEKEGTVGADQVEESPTVLRTEALENLTLGQTGKRRKVQVSDECPGTRNAGRAQISGLNSSEREETGQTRVSRSSRKKEKVAKSTLRYSAKSASIELISTNHSAPAEGPPSSWSSSRTTRRRKSSRPHGERSSDVPESCLGVPAACSRSSDGTSDSKRVRRNNIRQAKHKSETSVTQVEKRPGVGKTSSTARRVKRAADAFEDQGMSMSLTLKVGSGLDGGKDASSIVTCGITTKGEEVMLAGASCPSTVTPEDFFSVKNGGLTHPGDGKVETADKRRRWCVCSEQDEVDQDDDPTPALTSSGRGSNRLKRSFSCPDITSLRHGNDAPVHERTPCHPSPLKKASQLNADASSPSKRTRRHTVCSVEIEREIAPLCLRKEVYPKWGSTSTLPYPRSPSKSVASLVSCFLSSPLAFLSKKSSRGHGDDSGYRASSGDLLSVASSASPSPHSRNSSAASTAACGSAFFADAPRAPEQSSRCR